MVSFLVWTSAAAASAAVVLAVINFVWRDSQARYDWASCLTVAAAHLFAIAVMLLVGGW